MKGFEIPIGERRLRTTTIKTTTIKTTTTTTTKTTNKKAGGENPKAPVDFLSCSETLSTEDAAGPKGGRGEGDRIARIGRMYGVLQRKIEGIAEEMGRERIRGGEDGG